MRLILETDSLLTLKYKKGNCAEFGPVNVFQFERGSVKPIPCMRIKLIIIIIIIITTTIIIIIITIIQN